MPMSERAELYGGTSPGEVEFTEAVDGLVRDVLKKLNHVRNGEVNLDPPPRKKQGSSPFALIRSGGVLTKVSTDWN
jgi:hypothetical protein